jgi:hypothetical protein
MLIVTRRHANTVNGPTVVRLNSWPGQIRRSCIPAGRFVPDSNLFVCTTRLAGQLWDGFAGGVPRSDAAAFYNDSRPNLETRRSCQDSIIIVILPCAA